MAANCVNGTVPSRKQHAVFAELVHNFPNVRALFDVKFSNSDILWLLAHNMRTFGQCKICNSLLSREQHIHDRKYCKMQCYKQDPEANAVISNIKTELYNNPEWKKQTEHKKIVTNLLRSGFSHPMQDPVSFERQQKSSKQAYAYMGLHGLRGYERHAIDKLLSCGISPDDIQVGSSWLAQYQYEFSYTTQNGKRRHYIPDLWVASMNSVIEVKSMYTLEQSEYDNEMFYKAHAITKQGFDLILWVFDNKGQLLLDCFFKSLLQPSSQQKGVNTPFC